MEHEPVAELPRYVPARMVNEFVYCPRSCYLAWVMGETGENELTAEGKWQHRRVDQPSGKPPTTSETGSPRSTDVTVSSERLGVIARIDILEDAHGAVIPVELKRGRARDSEHPVWEPERVQMAVAALILRDNGFKVPYVEVKFTDSNTRSRIELTDSLIERTLHAINDIREIALKPLPPPPLVDSPKCPTCIMNIACLPDEHHTLDGTSGHPPRRLTAPDLPTTPLYVSEPGARIGVDGNELVVKKQRDELSRVRLIDISQVCLFGNVQISTQAIREVMFRDLAVLCFSGNGWFQGMTTPLGSGNVQLRQAQFTVSDALKLHISRRMVVGKILNTRVLLRRNAPPEAVADSTRELKRLSRLAQQADSFERLLGVEGGAARVYFSHFNKMLKGDEAAGFDFRKRTRRPPTDPVNCLLSYSYSLLAKDCTVAAASVGLDPYFGVFHRPRFGRPALALDLAEEFRALIADSTVITLINNHEVRPTHFDRRGSAVGLTATGRKVVIGAYERRMATDFTHPTFAYRLSYRRAIEVQARLLAATLLGEFDNYTAVVTR